jgi:hypothetical protein
MRLALATLPALLAATFAAGCASVAEVKCDQDKIRNALVELYTNQVIDNLILAANGMPFIQVDYSNATSTVTIAENGSLGGNQQITDVRPLNPAARLASVARGIMNVWNYSAGASNSNQIALTANPVNTNPEVYDAYLEYLTLPGSLRVSCDAPPEGAAHVCRKWHGNYFWVPVEYRTQFLRLALLTTAQRGRRLLPTPDFYAVTLTGITDDRTTTFDRRNGVFTLALKVDKKVPNDAGRVEFDVGDKHLALPVRQFAEGGVSPFMTDQILVTFSPEKAPDLNGYDAVRAALPVGAKLYLNAYRPDSPATTDELLQNVRFQLEQIRFNQLRP